jgi:hypothetical protein
MLCDGDQYRLRTVIVAQGQMNWCHFDGFWAGTYNHCYSHLNPI